MTETASPNQPDAPSELARFLQDWIVLWAEELQAQAGEPVGTGPAEDLARAMADPLRAVLGAWPGAGIDDRDGAATARPAAVAAASDLRDATIEHLVRRVGELEARIARLESRRGRRG